MRYKSYSQLLDVLIYNYRAELDYKGQRVPGRTNKALGCKHAMCDHSGETIEISDHVDTTSFKSWNLYLTQCGDLAFQLKESLSKHSVYARPVILVRGFYDHATDTEYTAYSVQMRPGTATKRVSEVIPIDTIGRKVGDNRCNILSMNGDMLSTGTYTVPGAEKDCTINGEGWILYNSDTGRPCRGEKFVSSGDLYGPVYHQRVGVYHPRNSISGRQTRSMFYGESKTKTEWYESIRDTYNDTEGAGQYGVSLRNTMLLAARAHKAALEFAARRPNSKIYLLPMIPERYAFSDCRLKKDNWLALAYSGDWGMDSIKFSSAGRTLQYIGRPSMGNGVLMPSIVVQWTPIDGREMVKGESDLAQRLGHKRQQMLNSVAITIPPSGHQSFGAVSAFDLSAFYTVNSVEHSGNSLYHTDKNGYSVIKNGTHGWWDKQNGLTREDFLTNPRRTFLALKENVTGKNWEYLPDGMRGTIADNEYLTPTADTKHIGDLTGMARRLVDWSQNQDCVAVQFAKTEPERHGWRSCLTYAQKPEEIFVALEQDALIDSLPLC